MKKILAVLVFLLALLCYRLYAQDIASDMLQIETRANTIGEIAGCSRYAFLGAIAGALTTEAIFTRSVQTSIDNPAHYALNSMTGVIDFIPDSVTTTSQVVDTSQAWQKVVGTVAGAAISVGIYELGHRVLRWW